MSAPRLSTPGPRILFVNHASRLAGAELVLLDVVRAFPGASAFLFEDGPLRAALAAAGVTPILPPRAGSLAGIKRDRSLLRALPRFGGLARMLVRLGAAARRHDLVYANSQKAFVLAAPACAAIGRKLIWHLHDILSPSHFGRGQIALTVRLANRWASAVIVPSRAAADAFTDAGGHRRLIRVVPNGLDDPPAGAAVPSRGDLGLRLPFAFGVFSRLSPWKGQDVALRALTLLPDMECVIAGGALFGEEEYARSLRTLAAELGVAGRVRFLGQRDDVPALMRAVDAVVHPSIDPEPFGRTLVEAMLARCPIVASDAGAVPEILDGGAAGLLFPPGDPAALAACLKRVQEGGAQMGDVKGGGMLERAEARAREFYNARRMRDAIQDAVAEIAAARS